MGSTIIAMVQTAMAINIYLSMIIVTVMVSSLILGMALAIRSAMAPKLDLMIIMTKKAMT